MVESALQAVLSDHRVLLVWSGLVVASLLVVVYDLRTNNRALPSLMRGVWTLTVIYSGPLGLAVYWYAGRTQMERDSLWKRGLRSVAHCYSGCGAGEITGIVLLAGVLAVSSTLLTAAVTFSLAYVFGFALTVGPLMQDGVPLPEAVRDAFYSETPSITVMEVVAIGTDVWLAGDAHVGEPLFWSALAFSLSIGLFAAYPVNLALIAAGVKEGMGNPAEMSQADAS